MKSELENSLDTFDPMGECTALVKGEYSEATLSKKRKREIDLELERRMKTYKEDLFKKFASRFGFNAVSTGGSRGQMLEEIQSGISNAASSPPQTPNPKPIVQAIVVSPIQNQEVEVI